MSVRAVFPTAAQQARHDRFAVATVRTPSDISAVFASLVEAILSHRPFLRIRVVLVASLFATGTPQLARAQLFGTRTLGQGVNSPSAQVSTGGRRGPLSGRGGRAAFQRPRPDAVDFVGRGRLERETFIGRAQGQVTLAGSDTSAGLRRSRAQEILRRRRVNANVLQIQRGTGAKGPVYTPRLEVNFDHRSTATALSDRQTEQTIAKIFAAQGLSAVKISAESGVATLYGRVASQDLRRLAAAVVNLEPGVGKIHNQLQLLSDPLPGAE